jgi:hypothetical protein
MPLGLSSLGRCEGRVLPNLDAVIASLAALDGEPRQFAHPRSAAFYRGNRLLRRHTNAVFGPAGTQREVRIIVTLASEAQEYPFVRALVERGADVLRINCATTMPTPGRGWPRTSARPHERRTARARSWSTSKDHAPAPPGSPPCLPSCGSRSATGSSSSRAASGRTTACPSSLDSFGQSSYPSARVPRLAQWWLSRAPQAAVSEAPRGASTSPPGARGLTPFSDGRRSVAGSGFLYLPRESAPAGASFTRLTPARPTAPRPCPLSTVAGLLCSCPGRGHLPRSTVAATRPPTLPGCRRGGRSRRFRPPASAAEQRAAGLLSLATIGHVRCLNPTHASRASMRRRPDDPVPPAPVAV